MAKIAILSIIMIFIFFGCSDSKKAENQIIESKMTAADHLQAAKEALMKGDTITANAQLSFIKKDSKEYLEAQKLQEEIDKKRKEYNKKDSKIDNKSKKSKKDKELDEIKEAIMKNIGKDISMDMYQKIKIGMNYKDVVKITGRAGTEMSRTELAGFITVMLMFQNENGSNMNIMFQNGKVVSKAQFGLQ